MPKRMAEVTAAYLDRHGPTLQDGQQGWNSAFLMELGAVLRIHQWQIAGIKDAIDASLPSSDAAFADLAQRLQTEPGAIHPRRGSAVPPHRDFLVATLCGTRLVRCWMLTSF